MLCLFRNSISFLFQKNSRTFHKFNDFSMILIFFLNSHDFCWDLWKPWFGEFPLLCTYQIRMWFQRSNSNFSKILNVPLAGRKYKISPVPNRNIKARKFSPVIPILPTRQSGIRVPLSDGRLRSSVEAMEPSSTSLYILEMHFQC